MNPDTGAIAHFETEEDAAEAGYTVRLTAEQARKLLEMTRRERRAWAKAAVNVSNLERVIHRDV